MRNLRDFVLLFLLSFLTACGEKEVESLSVYQTMDDLKGKKVGTLTGCFQEALLEKEYPEVEVLRFDLDTDMLQALLAKRCDAIVMDNHIFLYHTQNLKGIKTLEAPLVIAEMGFCFGKGQQVELRQQFNEFLKKTRRPEQRGGQKEQIHPQMESPRQNSSVGGLVVSGEPKFTAEMVTARKLVRFQMLLGLKSILRVGF